MSNFVRNTRHPINGEFEPALWIDDFYGPHKYAVKFRDGLIIDPDKREMETNEDPVDFKWEDFETPKESHE